MDLKRIFDTVKHIFVESSLQQFGLWKYGIFAFSDVTGGSLDNSVFLLVFLLIVDSVCILS